MKQGTLLFIRNYKFENGTSKNKFLLVLKQTQNKTILISLPSSQDYVPAYQEIKHGCIDIEQVNFNCYCFIANQKITDTDFYFSKNTFLYGNWINEIITNNFLSQYIETLDYKIIGAIHEKELSDIIECFKKSPTVKNKFKKMF